MIFVPLEQFKLVWPFELIQLLGIECAIWAGWLFSIVLLISQNYEIVKPTKMAKYTNRPIFSSSVAVVHMIKLA